MPEIIKTKTIKTSREPKSPYKIYIKNVTASDIVVVNIDHATKSYRKTFRFDGGEVIKKKTLSFIVYDDGHKIEIIWNSTQPING